MCFREETPSIMVNMIGNTTTPQIKKLLLSGIMKLLPLKSLFLTRQVCNSRKSKHFIKTVCYGKKQETGEQLYTVTQKGNILLKNTQITNMEILGNFH